MASRARGTDPEAFLSDPTRSHGNGSSGAGFLSGELAEWLGGVLRDSLVRARVMKTQTCTERHVGQGFRGRGFLLLLQSPTRSIQGESNTMERMKETCG